VRGVLGPVPAWPGNTLRRVTPLANAATGRRSRARKAIRAITRAAGNSSQRDSWARCLKRSGSPALRGGKRILVTWKFEGHEGRIEISDAQPTRCCVRLRQSACREKPECLQVLQYLLVQGIKFESCLKVPAYFICRMI